MNIPISLYIHLPYCLRKCPYCDFNSHELKQGYLPEEHYIDTLIQECAERLPLLQDRNIISIFIGGGTPNLFSPQSLARLFNFLKNNLNWPNEITLEANPGKYQEYGFSGYKECGITRISLGVQSFNNKHLKKLGRIHDTMAAQEALKAIKSENFTSYNIDIMYGLSEQTVQEAMEDLKFALTFEPPHLSWYQLTLEPNTLYHKFPPILPKEKIMERIQTNGEALITTFLPKYEVSAYGKLTDQCQHNLNYWQFGDYLGIGAGAAGKITDLHTKKILRYTNIKHPSRYLDSKLAFSDPLSVVPTQELLFEFMLNTARLQAPVLFEWFLERTFLPLAPLHAMLAKAQEQGFVTYNTSAFQITDYGQRFLNDFILLSM